MALTEATMVDQVIAMPNIKRLMASHKAGGLALSAADLRKMAETHADSAINEVMLSYDWDFVTKEHTADSVADTSDYELVGEENDALRIVSVKYGDDEVLLDKKTLAAMDDIKCRQTITAVGYWIEIEPSDQKFPQVRIVATPSTSGETISYRYWRSDMNLSMFPDLLDFVFVSALAKRLDPSHAPVFQADLTRGIRLYTRGGGEVDVTVKDKVISQRHYERAQLHGWS